MAPIDDVRRQAVLLTDDSVGVATEQSNRKIQANGEAFKITLSPSWLDQLNLAKQSAETTHSLSLGMRPVIVQQPAIIVQPAALIEEIESSSGHRHARNGRGAPW